MIKSMQLHEIKVTKKQRGRKSIKVGRGGLRGKTSGRGHKGQNARAGRKKRPEMRDMIKKLPKLRGHGINRSRTINDSKIKTTSVNLDILQNIFADGEIVNIHSLIEKGVVDKKSGKLPKVKILAKGEITRKLKIEGLEISATAKTAIEKAGGEVK